MVSLSSLPKCRLSTCQNVGFYATKYTRSSGDSRLEARFSPEGRLAHARVMPRRPRSRMMRATRLREVRTPGARSRMNVLGAS